MALSYFTESDDEEPVSKYFFINIVDRLYAKLHKIKFWKSTICQWIRSYGVISIKIKSFYA